MIYHTPEQAAQVTKFVEEFLERVEWMKSDDGVDMLSDKCTMDDGSISKQSMLVYFILFAMDQAVDHEMDGQQLQQILESSALRFAMSSLDQDVRDALKPIYGSYPR